MKWSKSPTGIPYLDKGRIRFILNISADKKIRWLTFNIIFGQKTAIHSHIYLRTGKVFPLGLEFKFTRGLTRHFTPEEKKFVYDVRKWIKDKPVRTLKEIKWQT